MMFSHLGQTLLYSFGVPEDLLSLYKWYDRDSITHMLGFHLMCPAALNLGTTIYFYRNGNFLSIHQQILNRTQVISDNKCHEPLLDLVLIISLLFAAYKAVEFWTIRRTLSYADYFESRTVDGGFFVVVPLILSIVLSIRYVLIGKYRKYIYSVWGAIILIYMIGGSRSAVIPYIGVFSVMLPMTHPHLFTRKKIFLWLVVVFFAFAMLSIISTNRTETVSTAVLASNQSILTSAMDTMAEMGGSALTTVLSIQAVDSGVLPHYQTNLFFILACILPASFVEFITGMDNIQLAAWITDYAGSNWSGLGYSCVAEAYVNYGTIGWIWFIVYGFVITWMECYAYKNIAKGNYFIPALFLYILASAIFYARAEIYSYQGAVRYCFYIWIIYMFLRHLKVR